MPTEAYALDSDESTEQIILEVSYDPNDSFFNGVGAQSWYGSSLYLSATSYSGQKRYYDGNNVGIEMTCSAAGGSACDSYFSVELHRKNSLLEDTYIGSAPFKRNGFSKATWSNVGSGNYFFKFVKCSDSQSISSNDVAMYSW